MQSSQLQMLRMNLRRMLPQALARAVCALLLSSSSCEFAVCLAQSLVSVFHTQALVRMMAALSGRLGISAPSSLLPMHRR